MAAVVFDYTAWSARYPALAAVTTQPTAQAMFDDAGATLLSNDDCVVPDEAKRLVLLNMLVAHLATLEYRSTAAGPSGGFLGSLKNATEGSVTVGATDYPVGSGKWFEQTQPGAAFWQASKSYRQGHYTSGPRYITGAPAVFPGFNRVPFIGRRF